jgi:hypothetical protein
MTGVRSPAEAKGFSSSLCIQTSSDSHPASFPIRCHHDNYKLSTKKISIKLTSVGWDGTKNHVICLGHHFQPRGYKKQYPTISACNADFTLTFLDESDFSCYKPHAENVMMAENQPFRQTNSNT